MLPSCLLCERRLLYIFEWFISLPLFQMSLYGGWRGRNVCYFALFFRGAQNSAARKFYGQLTGSCRFQSGCFLGCEKSQSIMIERKKRAAVIFCARREGNVPIDHKISLSPQHAHFNFQYWVLWLFDDNFSLSAEADTRRFCSLSDIDRVRGEISTTIRKKRKISRLRAFHNSHNSICVRAAEKSLNCILLEA